MPLQLRQVKFGILSWGCANSPTARMLLLLKSRLFMQSWLHTLALAATHQKLKVQPKVIIPEFT